ncbi:TackOD1 domain-containing metal-binding protein [Paracraurococcus ruber]|uniref:TackOD1 domain-containing metal-binding protein n=1 Tax=Paracraurococcus ruber TaxID=77675 RepID=UPI001057E0AC|nr:hypothetical protein [Paracraurococcus ruber]TDG33116.1 hypothetical protein E2C05_05015 [Paracraurococcus ruber]
MREAAPAGFGWNELETASPDIVLGRPPRPPALPAIEGVFFKADAAWQELGLADRPAALVLRGTEPPPVRMLRGCFDLSGRRPAEAILLPGPEALEEAAEARLASAHALLPVIDLSGRCPEADASFAVGDRASWAAVAGTLAGFAERRRSLPPRVLQAADLDTRLLAWTFIADRALQPRHDPGSRACVRYPGCFPQLETRLAAERLAGRGLLRRHFFDRFHACGDCGSFRLNVREECGSCRSPRLESVELIHHFRCAHQAPASHFARGTKLVCPKCSAQLRHYGSDHTRSGTVQNCLACGMLSPEPSIGFACLDCGGHTEGAAAARQDIFGYALTADGEAALRQGTVGTEAAAAEPGRLPAEIRAALAGAGPGTVLLALRYAAREKLLRRRGQHGFDAMRRLFLANLASTLEADSLHVATPEADWLLLQDAAPGLLAALTPRLLRGCEAPLAEPLEASLQTHDPLLLRAMA